MRDKLELALQKNVIALFAFTVFLAGVLVVGGMYLLAKSMTMQDRESIAVSIPPNTQIQKADGATSNAVAVDTANLPSGDPSVGRAARIDSELETCTASNGSTYGLMECSKKAQIAYDALLIQARKEILGALESAVVDARNRSMVVAHDPNIGTSSKESLVWSIESYINGVTRAKEELVASNSHFEKYRDAICAYAYDINNDGSIRYALSDSCRLEVTKSYLREMCSPVFSNVFCESLR